MPALVAEFPAVGAVPKFSFGYGVVASVPGDCHEVIEASHLDQFGLGEFDWAALDCDGAVDRTVLGGSGAVGMVVDADMPVEDAGFVGLDWLAAPIAVEGDS